MIEYQTFEPGIVNSPEAALAGAALARWVASETPFTPARRIILRRLEEKAAQECCDTYFIALDSGKCVSRLWCGWGRHRDAIGNFGHFNTLEDHRQMGIGGELVKRWFADLNSRSDLPLGLFCSSSKPHLVRLYGRYGFRPALRGADRGYLYCPLGNSPANFQEFCREYYRPAAGLHFIPGTLEYRHEIDCLLRFALADAGENEFGWPGSPSYETALAAWLENSSAPRPELAVNAIGHIVGWRMSVDGIRQTQLHPAFRTQASA